jgi:hypothetical protein
MISSLKFKSITKNTFIGFVTTLTVMASFISSSTGKPSNWSYKIGENVRFDFKGCTRSTSREDIICVGNFRSRNGEASLGVATGSGNSKLVSITDSQGNLTFADEIRIGDNWSCRVGADCAGTIGGNLVLVEGVDYKTLFIFKETSLPSTKIALFNFRSSNIFDQFEIKVRNINITTSDSR